MEARRFRGLFHLSLVRVITAILLVLLIIFGLVIYLRVSFRERAEAGWVNGPALQPLSEEASSIVEILESDNILWIASNLEEREVYTPATAVGVMITKYIKSYQGRYFPGSLDQPASLRLTTRFRQETEKLSLTEEEGEALISPLYSAVTQCIVRKGDIHSLQDLKGKRVSLGEPKADTTLLNRSFLSIQGLDPSDYEAVYLDLDKAVRALEDKTIDCLVLSSVLPNQQIANLAANLEIELLPVEGHDIIDHLERYLPGCRIARINAGTYKGQDVLILSVATDVLLCTPKTAGRDIVYDITKAIYGNLSEIKKVFPMDRVYKTTSFNNSAIGDLHQGALEYYREQGIIWR